VPNIVVSPTFLWRTARLTRLPVVGVRRRPWGAQIGGCEMQATLRWHWTYNRKVYSQTLRFLGVVKPCACVVRFGADMFRSRSSKVIVSHIAHSWGKCRNMGECSRRCPLVSLLDHNNVGTCEFGQGHGNKCVEPGSWLSCGSRSSVPEQGRCSPIKNPSQ
jgi:hypothetical protein